MPTQEKGAPPRPTLIDVARHAGVSIASVSRVLNNIPPISAELRTKVESATRALGYTTRKSASPFQPSVVALIGDAHNTYFSEVLAGIQDQATRNGYLVTIVVSEPDAGFPERFYRWLTHTSMEGLILCSSTGIPEEDLMRIGDFSDLPISAINRTFSAARIPSIRIDYERAIAKAVRHTVQFRHRRIAFINGNEGSYSSRTKLVGVQTTLVELGFPLEKDLHIERSATVEGGFEAMNILFDSTLR